MLLEVKQRTVRDLQQPSRKHLAYYQELFHLTEKQLRNIAEATSGASGFQRPNRQKSEAGSVFELELGGDHVSASMQQSVHTYLRHQRPGLVMISILRARSDQLLNLSRNFKLNFKLTNHAGMKKFIDTRKNVRKLLELICQLGITFSELGLNFAVECSWPVSSWQSRCPKKLEKLPSAVRAGCVQELRGLHDSDQADPGGLITNHSEIARAVNLRSQNRRGSDWSLTKPMPRQCPEIQRTTRT